MQQVHATFNSRRKWWVAAACLLAVFAGYLLWGRPGRPLNVVLVTFDTTRADHLGIHGYDRGLTDVFDQFAEQGVVFDRAYAPVPLTLPSHATMLTGLNPPEHGLRVNGSGKLGDKAPFIPELFQKQGYDTGAFVAAFVLNSKFGLNRGFDVYDDDMSDAEPAGEHSFDRRRTGARVVDSALKWLEQRTARPFFCWIHLYDAHFPYDPRTEQFDNRFAQAPYDAGIAVEVQQFARVLQFLKDRQLLNSTIVVVAGDHGEGLGEHGEDEHGYLLYNTTLRVPLVVASPRGCRPGHRVGEPVSLVDLAPTLLDLTGIQIPEATSGRSLRAALAGGSLSPRPCYAETQAPFLDDRWSPMQALISDRWKYVQTTRGELFDLEQDPGETTNLWETAPEQRKEMSDMLAALQKQFVPLGAGSVQLSDKDRRILSSLGYVAGASRDDAGPATAETLPDMKDMLPHRTSLEQVRRLIDAGELENAERLARVVVAATTPNYPTAEVTLGDVLRLRGLPEDAAAIYQAVLDRHPDCLQAHSRLGDYYVSQEKWPEAAAQYRAVIGLQSEASHAYFALAQALSRMGQYEDAILEYRQAIRSDPGFVTAHFELGLLLAKGGRFQNSIHHFEQALKYDPQLSEAHLNLSSVLMQLKRVPEALQHAQQAVDVDGESFAARFHLGTILLMQRNYKNALIQFRQAQRLDPDDPLPKARIEQLEKQLGREQPI